MSRPSANPAGNPSTSLAPKAAGPENLAPLAPPPPVPSHLGPTGRKVWAELWAAGQNAYRPETDVYVVERYATLQERRRDLMNTLEAEGWTTVGSQGQTVPHPAAKLLLDVESKLTGLEDRLGLNPESRLRLGIAATDKRTKLDRFMDEADED